MKLVLLPSVILAVSLISRPVECDVTFVRNVANLITNIVENRAVEDLELSYPLDDAEEHTFAERSAVYDVKDVEIGPRVNTTSGFITGAKVTEAFAFYSVPFADKPERYQPPQPVSKPFEEFNATTPNGLVCYQRKKECNNGVCIENISEDCLVLNIHVPLTVDFSSSETASKSALPVFIWFYGGGFMEGGATVPEFEARWFSNATKAIMVAVNYRLGAFGFLVHGTGKDAITGNQGLKDQQLAMQWVQDNIGSFGGDPNKVTIFGNSAGAQSVMFHFVSDVSKPLFQRGIMESNPAVFQYQTLFQAKQTTRKLLRFLNCSDETPNDERECLINADPDDINRALPKVMASSLIAVDPDIWSTVEAFRPILDGEEFKEQPFAMIRDGNWQKEKDLIIGTNTQELEITQFYIPKKIPLNETAFRAVNRIVMGSSELGGKVSDYYTSMVKDQPDPDYKVLIGIEATHMFFVCPSRLMARLASNTGNGKVYLYSDAHPMGGPACPDVVRVNQTCGYAYHGSEPPFVFRSGPGYGFTFTENDTIVSNQFDSYWTNFAENGDPSKGGLSELGDFEAWPEYVIDDATTKEAFRRGEEYNRKYMWGKENDKAQRFKSVNSIFKNYWQRDERATSSPWANIRIEAPKSSVQTGYLEDICDFWDGLNFYVDLGVNATSPTSVTNTVGSSLGTTPAKMTTVVTEPNDATTTDGAVSARAGSHALIAAVIPAWIITNIWL